MLNSRAVRKHVNLKAPLQLLISYHTAVNITVIVNKSAITWPEVQAAHVMTVGLTGPLCAAINVSITTTPLALPQAHVLIPTPPPCFLVVEWLQPEGSCTNCEHHSCIPPFFSHHQPLLLDPVLNSPHAALFNQAVTRFSCYCVLAFTWQPSP